MVTRYTILTTMTALALCLPQACSKRAGSDKAPGSAPALQSPAQSEPMGFQYPPGRWRLALFEELERTTLWIGHIAIRHEKSRVEVFRPIQWRPDPPNPKRSVAEALALAERVAAQAATSPGDFEQLARKYSEDIVTRDDGGMLGGVRASQLIGSDFLDVLAVLKPGEVSKPFRTPYGFHILKRYPPPAEVQVAGERIVIGYDGAFGLINESRRSREEALQLAKEVAEKAKREKQGFRKLVDRYSESLDRATHGDLGVYSTRDPGYFPREIHHLAGLEIGEVTGPMDSGFGFEILRRASVRPRVEYAMTAIALPFELRPDLRDASMARALKEAESVRHELESKPEQFEEFQQIHCCREIRRWTDGRGDIDLSRALDALAMGEIAKNPLLNGSAYWVIKRLDPNRLPPEQPRLAELPNPSEPDFDGLLKYNSGRQIAGAARSFAEAIQKSFVVSPQAIHGVGEALGDLAAKLERNPDDGAAIRANVYASLAVIKNQLSAEQFSRFEFFGRQWAISVMMQSGSVD
jgi:hypothetical protein